MSILHTLKELPVSEQDDHVQMNEQTKGRAICVQDVAAEAERAGFLYVKGSQKRWKKRYFILKGNILYYFPNAKSKTAFSGYFRIPGVSQLQQLTGSAICACRVIEHSKRLNVFKIFTADIDSDAQQQPSQQHHSTKEAYFCGSSPHDVEKWISIINFVATLELESKRVSRFIPVAPTSDLSQAGSGSTITTSTTTTTTTTTTTGGYISRRAGSLPPAVTDPSKKVIFRNYQLSSDSQPKNMVAGENAFAVVANLQNTALLSEEEAERRILTTLFTIAEERGQISKLFGLDMLPCASGEEFYEAVKHKRQQEDQDYLSPKDVDAAMRALNVTSVQLLEWIATSGGTTNNKTTTTTTTTTSSNNGDGDGDADATTPPERDGDAAARKRSTFTRARANTRAHTSPPPLPTPQRPSIFQRFNSSPPATRLTATATTTTTTTHLVKDANKKGSSTTSSPELRSTSTNTDASGAQQQQSNDAGGGVGEDDVFDDGEELTEEEKQFQQHQHQ